MRPVLLRSFPKNYRNEQNKVFLLINFGNEIAGGAIGRRDIIKRPSEYVVRRSSGVKNRYIVNY